MQTDNDNASKTVIKINEHWHDLQMNISDNGNTL